MSSAITAAVVVAGSAAYGAHKAGKAADAAAEASERSSNEQTQLGYEQLDFQKSQYEDWEAIYGPIQDNLSEYHQNLTPDSYAAQGLQGLQESYSQAKQSLEQSLAKRGISDSGVAAAAQAQLEGTRMLGGADIRAQSENQVIQQQSNFLGLGLGTQGTVQSGVANSLGNLSNIAGNQASAALQQQTAYDNQASQSASGIGNALGSGVAAYNTYSALNPSGTTYVQPQTVNLGATPIAGSTTQLSNIPAAQSIY